MEFCYWIGLDLGTSSTKAVAFTAGGDVLLTKQCDYPLHQNEPDAAEQDPEQIVQAAEEVLRAVCQALAEPPQAIGLVSVMHSIMIADEEGRALSPLYTWADLRPKMQAKALRESEIGPALFNATGVPIHPMSPLCKLLWLKERQAWPTEKKIRFVGIKDYLLHRWFGEWLIDTSTASATGLMDLGTKKWYDPALALAGINAQQLPTLCSPLYRLPVGASTFLSSLAWPAEVAVVVGGADGCLANVGAGAMVPSTAALTIGTSGAVRMVSNRLLTDQKMRLFSYHLAEDRYVIGGASNNGGKAWEWFCDRFYPAQDVVLVQQKALQLTPGAEGLRMIPYLFGERAPLWDADVQGAIWQLTHRHRPEHFARAFLEGIIFNLQLSLDNLSEHFGKPECIKANGGFLQSDGMGQLLADMLGIRIDLAHSPHATAYGAVLLARKANGSLQDWSEVKGLPTKRSFLPDAALHTAYQAIFSEWKSGQVAGGRDQVSGGKV